MTNQEYEKYLRDLSDENLFSSINVLKNMPDNEKNEALFTVENLAIEEWNSRLDSEDEDVLNQQ
jgi:hypothetical protein|tara:strand:- start:133 stop:324 length:192 start_codon:yes stop_codon:yes gene_type:complete